MIFSRVLHTKKATIFDHYVIIQPIPKMDHFLEPLWIFGATLFICKMVSAFHTNNGFILRWSFSLCWKQKSKYIFHPISSYSQCQKWMIFLEPLLIFWCHCVKMPNGVCLSYQWCISLQMDFLSLKETKKQIFFTIMSSCSHYQNMDDFFWSHSVHM